VQLSDAANRLLTVLDPDGLLIGGLCGAVYGIERFTRDVDVATTLDADAVLSRLHQAGIEAGVRSSREPGDLSWVVFGEIGGEIGSGLGGIEFQVLPANETGMQNAKAELKAGLRVPDINSFIVSKCIAAGQQDMHDVASLCLMHPELAPFARASASEHGCLDKLESWLADRRLQQRYLPEGS